MRMSPQSLLIIIVLTIITGFTDARGFMHASSMWDERGLVPAVALKAVTYFAIGIPTYMLTLYFLRRQGVVVAELQVMFWFMVTVVGVGVMSGRFLTWGTIDRVVAGMVVAGMIWLVVRVGG